MVKASPAVGTSRAISWPISSIRRVSSRYRARRRDLPADRVLVVVMGGAQTLEPGDIGFKPCLLHQALIA
jgi:hypothetical protein